MADHWNEEAERIAIKTRTFKDMVQHYEQALLVWERSHAIFLTWWDEAKRVSPFYGVLKKNKYIIEIGEGLGCNQVNDPLEILQTTPRNQYPTLLGAFPFNDDEGKALLEQALKGKIKALPLRQDLMDRYRKIDVRENHVRYVVGVYRSLMETYVLKKHQEVIYGRRYEPTSVVMKVNGREYRFTNLNKPHHFEMDLSKTIIDEGEV